MHRRVVGPLALLSLIANGCIIPEKATPAVGLGATLATRYVHRGMTLVDKPVLQPKLSVGLPTTTGNKLNFAVEGNIDLYSNTGDAWFPNGHAGRFTELEVVASETRQIGDLTITSGLHSYILPNGQEFDFKAAGTERGGTNEYFVLASVTVLEANPYFAWNYDFDEVRGAYYRVGITEDIPLGGRWSLDLDGSLGYVTEAQSSWMYGFDQSGLADLRGEAVVKWQYDERTQVRGGVHGSMIVDSAIDEWFNTLPVDDDPIWFTLGVAWVF